MATKSSSSTTPAQVDTTTGDVVPGEKLIYFNDQAPQSPRYHQPANPDEAERVAKDAADRAAAANVDNSAIKPQPSDLSDPRKAETVKKADDVNEEIAKRKDTP